MYNEPEMWKATKEQAIGIVVTFWILFGIGYWLFQYHPQILVMCIYVFSFIVISILLYAIIIRW